MFLWVEDLRPGDFSTRALRALGRNDTVEAAMFRITFEETFAAEETVASLAMPN